MGIGKRIKEARLKRQLSQKELAAAVNITQPSLSEIEKESTQNPRNVHKFAKVLQVSEIWLRYGEESTQYQIIQGVNRATQIQSSTIKAISVFAKNIPILDWDDLPTKSSNSIKSVIDTHPPTGIITVTFKDDAIVAHKMFALIASESDAMVYPYPKKGSIYGGEILIIDIEKTPHPGDIVLAHANNSYFVRKLAAEGSNKYLQPYNPQYHVVSSNDAKIEGVVVQIINEL